MRTHLRAISIAALFTLQLLIATHGVPAQAIAQEGRPDGGRWSAGLYSKRDVLERNGQHALLDLAIVRKELRITAVQADDLEALQAKVKKAVNIQYTMSFEDLGGRDPGEAMAALMFENHNKSQTMLGIGTYQILNSAQKRRLREISLQLEGILAVARPEIQDALNMDPSQMLNVEEIKRKYDKDKITIYRKNTAVLGNQPLPKSKAEAVKLRTDKKLIEARNKQYDKNKAEFDTMREHAEAQIKRWLTRKQEAKFKKLCGEPFEDLELLSVPGFDWKQEELKRQKEEPKKEG